MRLTKRAKHIISVLLTSAYVSGTALVLAGILLMSIPTIVAGIVLIVAASLVDSDSVQP